MFRKIINYKIYSLVFQASKAKADVVALSRNVSVLCANPSNTNRAFIPRRLLTEKVKVEELIVDYEHVKNALTNSKIFIIDVREPEEIKEHGKIPNSVNIPLGNVSTVLGSMTGSEFEKTYKRPKPTEDSEIIFYCMIGKRSGMAQQNAINLGYKNVKNYLGSWTEWAGMTKNYR